MLSALENIPKERVFLGLIVILSAGFLLYQALIIFQIKKLKAVDLYFLSQKKLVDFYEQIMKNSAGLKNELKQTEETLRSTKEKFIGEEDLPNYFTHFRELAKSHALKVSSLDFKPQEAVSDPQGNALNHFQKLRFNVSLEGDYLDTLRLIYELEYVSPKIFDIQTVRIKQKNVQSRQIFTDIEVTVYIFTEKTQNDKT